MATHKGTLRGAATIGRTPPGTPTIKERWAAARAAGERTFDPGVPCVNGHESLRWTNSGICILCKRARDNAYNAAHKEEHRARAKRSALARHEEVKAYYREWRRANRGKVRANGKKREAKLRGVAFGCRKSYAAFVNWSKSAPSVRCYWCKRNTAPNDRQLDHIIPISKGGVDSVGNLCVSCRPCNRSKSAKLPEEFAGQSELRLA